MDDTEAASGSDPLNHHSAPLHVSRDLIACVCLLGGLLLGVLGSPFTKVTLISSFVGDWCTSLVKVTLQLVFKLH